MSICTGGGKTVLFCDIIKDRGNRALILAPRQELIHQAARKMHRIDSTLRVGVEYGNNIANDFCDVVVGSPQSLGTERGKKRLERLGDFGTIILDEFHHARASTWVSILEQQGFPCDGSLVSPEGKLLLGVTATLGRTDGEPLGHIAEEVVYSYGIRDAIEDGYLVDIRPYRIITETSLDGIQIQRGASGGDEKDYSEKELAKRINNERRNELILNGYLQHAKGKKTVIFCVNLAHVAALTVLFAQAGIRAEGLTKDTTDAERRGMLYRFENGETDVIINCMVLTEGYDFPGIECIIMARPTKSQLLFVQQLGRGLRTYCDIDSVETKEERLNLIASSPKPYLLLLDIVDNCSKNSPVMLPMLFGLNPNLETNGKAIFKTLKEIESAKEKAPRLRLDDIKDISDLTKLVTRALEINIWDAVELTEEVKRYSSLSWLSDAGNYYIPITDQKTITIAENVLGQFEIRNQEKGGASEIVSHYNSFGEAIANADNFIKQNFADRIILFDQKSKWKKDAASPAQLALLNYYFKIPIYTEAGRNYILGYDWIKDEKKGKNKPVPRCADGLPHIRREGKYEVLTKGMAGAMANSRFARK